MVRSNEITSTEKLLDIIRKKHDVSSREKESRGEPPSPIPLPPEKKALIIPLKKASFHKTTTVGVDIGHDHLRLIKTVKGADGVPALVDQKCVPIPSSLDRNSDEFANFLRSELNSFCKIQKRLQLWSIMSAANVEVHHIRIPKVPQKQLEQVVFWTCKKETPFDEKENIFDFEVLGEVIEQGIPKLAVIYYTAPRQEIEGMKRLFVRAGWPLTGLSIAPFAVQNLLRTGWLAGHEGTVASLFIGNDYSRIDIYAQGDLVMTRGIKAGISSMIESLLECFNERAALKGAGKREPLVDKNKARDILLSLSPDSPPMTKEVCYFLEEEEIWSMVLPAMERLVRQVERTFEHYTINLGNEKVDRIYVSGAMNVYRPIVQYVGEQLGINSYVFDPLSPQLACTEEKEDASACVSERIAFAPALGMALADNALTPNFIFNYKDKEKAAGLRRINRVIFAAFAAAMVFCSGVFLYQLHALDKKRGELVNLQGRLAQYSPQLDGALIMKSLAMVKDDAEAASAYSQKYLGLAVISELSAITPPRIGLLSMRAKLGSPPDKSREILPAKAGQEQVQQREVVKEVEVEGFVLGERKTHETALADYAIKLESSPLFHQVRVQRTNEESFRKAALLRFSLNMKIEGL